MVVARAGSVTMGTSVVVPCSPEVMVRVAGVCASVGVEVLVAGPGCASGIPVAVAVGKLPVPVVLA